MKNDYAPSRPLTLLIWLCAQICCGKWCLAQSSYLSFPMQEVSPPMLLPDIRFYRPLSIHFNGANALAGWSQIGRILDAQGRPLGDQFVLPWAVTAASNPPATYGSGWLVTRIREEPHTDPGGSSVVYITYIPEFVTIDAAGKVSAPVELDPGVSSGTINGVRVQSRYTTARAAGQDGWTLVTWGSRIYPAGVANPSPVFNVEGCWMRAGEAMGGKLAFLPGAYHSRVICADGAWLVLGQSEDHMTTTGCWLTTGASATGPSFPVPSRTGAIYGVSEDFLAAPITGGVVLGRATTNATWLDQVINHFFISRSGTVGPVLALGRPGSTSIQNYSLCEQSDGSLRAFWIDTVGNDSQWRTALIERGTGDLLTAYPSAEGEPISFFEPSQSFAAGIGPEGPVTVYTSNTSSTGGFVFSQHGVPLYPLGNPVKLSGTESLPFEPKVAATADGYVCAWLETRGETKEVWLMRYNQDGRSLWPEPVNATSQRSLPLDTTLATPAVMVGGGEICVGWMERGSTEAVYLQKFSLAGQRLGQPLWVDSHVPPDTMRALRLSYVDGRFVSVWRDRESGGASSILYAFASETSGREGGVVFAGTEMKVAPEIASRGIDALLVGQENDNVLRGIIIHSDGTHTALPASIRELSSPDEIESPAVAWSPAANAYLVAWIKNPVVQGTGTIEACRISATGVVHDATPLMLAVIPAGTFPSAVTVSATSQGWWVGGTSAEPTSGGLRAVLVSANGSVGTTQFLNPTPTQRFAGENLTSCAGLNGGILIGGETASPVKGMLQLIFPTESVPALSMQIANSNLMFDWPASPHFPAEAGVLEGSLDLKNWKPFELAPSTAAGSARMVVPQSDSKCFFRLQAKRIGP